MPRSGRFWRDREKEIVKRYGLDPVPGSGGLDWARKEDGENEHTIAQLKSTEGAEIKVVRRDLFDLFYHARLAHKIPLFILDFMPFIGTQEVQLLCVRPEDLQDLAKAMREKDEDEVQRDVRGS